MPKNFHELSRFLCNISKSGPIASAVDQIYLCVESGSARFTAFLDPQSRLNAANALWALPEYGVKMACCGGYPEAERMMLGFAPVGGPLEFPIAKLVIEYNGKHGIISHRDILGAVLGLGLNRAVIGDIVLLPDSAVVCADSKIKDFLIDSLLKVGRVGVLARLLPNDIDFFALDNRVKDRIVCASMRVDCVLAAAFGLSRAKASALVKSGKAFVNWQEIDSPSKTVKPGDTLTLRRFGRIVVEEIAGKTKKDCYLINIIRFMGSSG